MSESLHPQEEFGLLNFGRLRFSGRASSPDFPEALLAILPPRHTSFLAFYLATNRVRRAPRNSAMILPNTQILSSKPASGHTRTNAELNMWVWASTVRTIRFWLAVHLSSIQHFIQFFFSPSIWRPRLMRSWLATEKSSFCLLVLCSLAVHLRCVPPFRCPWLIFHILFDW